MLPVRSKTAICTSSQVDFQLVYLINLKNSGILPNSSDFFVDLTLFCLNPDEKVVGHALLKLPKKKTMNEAKRLFYISNHKDLHISSVKSGKSIGVIMVTLCIGPLNSLKVAEPTIKPREISATSLMIQQEKKESEEEEFDDEETNEEIIDEVKEKKYSSWEEEARDKGFVPPDEARKIWMEIARKKGWKPADEVDYEWEFYFDEGVTIEGIHQSIDLDDDDLITFSSDGETKNEVDEKKVMIDNFVDQVLQMRYMICSYPIFSRHPENELEDEKINASLRKVASNSPTLSLDSDNDDNFSTFTPRSKATRRSFNPSPSYFTQRGRYDARPPRRRAPMRAASVPSTPINDDADDDSNIPLTPLFDKVIGKSLFHTEISLLTSSSDDDSE